MKHACVIVASCLLLASANAARASDEPLASWNDGAAKASIVRFVQAVTDKASPQFVPPEDRIAVFDNDGTLLTEQPTYAQYVFAVERVKAVGAKHPEWKTQPPFQAALDDDLEAAASAGVQGMLDMVAASCADMTTEQFQTAVREWFGRTRHPRFHRPYNALIYQPMLEVLAYLRANGFQTWIVSGSSVEFLRPWTLEAYGIPPERVIGSTTRLALELRDDRAVLARGPEIDFRNDREFKPIAIEKHIGRRPIAAFGNSDGDLPMLEWTTAGAGTRFALIVHHDDAEREYAYDRNSASGKLDKGLTQAPARKWTLVSMKRDWKVIYPPAPESKP